MAKIAFFGAGLMGAGFVRRARANGIEVNVWNRSPAKAQALQASGARASTKPRRRWPAYSASIFRWPTMPRWMR